MANAAFDAWSVKFVKAVNSFNSETSNWRRYQKEQIRRAVDPIGSRAQQTVLSLRSEMASILSYDPVLSSVALNNLDKIINTGRNPISIKLIQEWIKKYSSLVK